MNSRKLEPSCEEFQSRINNFIADMWNAENQHYHMSHDQMQQLVDLIAVGITKIAYKHHEDYLVSINKQTNRIVAEKAELRTALESTGFCIPEGKRLGEWVGFIHPNTEEPQRAVPPQPQF